MVGSSFEEEGFCTRSSFEHCEQQSKCKEGAKAIPKFCVGCPTSSCAKGKVVGPALDTGSVTACSETSLEPVGQAKRNRWKNRGGRRGRRQRQVLRSLYPDTHTRMRYIQSRETLFSLLAHTKKHDTGADGYHAGPECACCSSGGTSEANSAVGCKATTLCAFPGDRGTVRAPKVITLFEALDYANNTMMSIGTWNRFPPLDAPKCQKYLGETTLELRHLAHRTTLCRCKRSCSSRPSTRVQSPSLGHHVRCTTFKSVSKCSPIPFETRHQT